MNISPSPLSLHNPPIGLQKHSRGPESNQSQGTLSTGENDIVELQNRDREVRNHEQAHIAASGGLSRGGASFSYQRGSDGKLYAVGGEVSIDTSPVPSNPQATIQKAQQIRAAALAPADPSAQDRAVATSANSMEATARQELQQKAKENGTPSERPSEALSSRIDLFV
ncbi:MAG: putative metalloprotease CJM1_0395 family protein [Nitrospirota bacterium]|nr:putative metalloprotease CJM1_0395 family protein [Nitrospirota bacterium]MDH5699498.1 putative metalloprotease CJM1_0395 family protein [Nitrospirota bacterium]